MRKHKVSRSLSLPPQMGGVDRKIAILNGTVTVLLTYSAMSMWFLVVGVTAHALLRWKTTKDPWWRETLVVYDRYADEYEPTPTMKFSARFRRPYGFDQDLPC